MKEKALILFLKYPEKGVVKTRLAKDTGDNFTLELYKCFIADILKTIKMIDADIFISSTAPDNKNSEYYRCEVEYSCFLQQGVDLGERMYHAFCDVRRRGYGKLVLIGSDTPDLPATYIDKAFQMLNKYEIVLGPSADGGYYLIALRKNTVYEENFSNISWGTSLVFEQTLERAKKRGSACGLLPVMNDIDLIDDLRRFYKRYKMEGMTSRTMAFLSRQEELFCQ
jgi:rSAM/selenodomain-associated transferase 1